VEVQTETDLVRTNYGSTELYTSHTLPVLVLQMIQGETILFFGLGACRLIETIDECMRNFEDALNSMHAAQASAE
jgi:hypothetical protein